MTDYVTITVDGVTQGAWLHWGINGWQQPDIAYWPANSVLFEGTGPAVQTTMIGPDENHELQIVLGPFNNPVQEVAEINFVIHYFDETWDNNNGNNYQIDVSPSSTLVDLKVYFEIFDKMKKAGYTHYTRYKQALKFKFPNINAYHNYYHKIINCFYIIIIF